MSTSDFVWYELMTSDVDAAAAFYTAVIGWNAVDSGMPDMQYTLVRVGERQVGGLMAMPPGAAAMDVKPGWVGYIGVDDVAMATDSAAGAGATVYLAPQAIPGVGHFSVIADPAGARICLFTGDGDPAPELPPMSPGSIGWHELHSADPDAAWTFYEGQFGWTKGDALDMGPMGTYQIFSTTGGTGMEMMSGGMMKASPDSPASGWLYYFVVDDIEAAHGRVTDNGGTVILPPTEVPGGAWIINALDPQGAMFALVGMRTA
ncbi:VOC family protein [Sphingobium aquiterrae]|uniref:VOC family protein n=1 Tax=Sphingobium aquiterrae TaxID=2038656 RepID=UPI0030178991